MKADLLKKGDTIAIVSTSDPLEVERTDEVESSKRFLEELGFKVLIGNYIMDNELGYGAKNEKKAKEINEMFLNPDVKAILSACGGNGANGLFEYLDFEIMKKNPKIICGYSDPTSILNVINERTGLVTFNGPNFTSLAEGFDGEAEFTRNQFIERFIKGKNNLGEANDYIVIKEGKAEGKLVGGNLCLTTKVSNGEYSVSFDDKILFIEELFRESSPRVVSSYLYYLKQNGVFDKIRGLWIGNYSSDISLEKIVYDVIGDKYDFPIIKSNNFGHIQNKIIIPIGANAKIDTESNEKIVLLENCLN